MEDFEVKAIRVWMRSIMDTKEWTANKWATLAGTSPTNITRFLNGAKFVPSSKTVGKLAAVAGSSPDLGGQDLMDLASQTIPFFDALNLRKLGTMTVYNVKGDLIAYRFNKDLTPYGLGNGDTLVVRKQTKFETGDTVVHEWLDNGLLEELDRLEGHAQGHSEIGLGVKIKSHNEIWKTKRKYAVSLNDVKVIGKLVQIIKNFE